jgi:A/G-specific adenine glycosylase
MAPRKKAAATAKAPKTIKAAKPSKSLITAPTTPLAAALPPSRIHQTTYHHPLLLSHRSVCDALLTWFEGVEETRSMPWRKKWIDSADFEGREEELGRVLSKRAYEVWVSEVSKSSLKIMGKDVQARKRVNTLSRAGQEIAKRR